MDGGGFQISDSQTRGYVHATREIAERLNRLARREIAPIRELADDSFGKIGKETGFAAALDHYAAALSFQLKGIADNADKLGDGMARMARAYRDDDEARAGEFAALLGGGED